MVTLSYNGIEQSDGELLLDKDDNLTDVMSERRHIEKYRLDEFILYQVQKQAELINGNKS